MTDPEYCPSGPDAGNITASADVNEDDVPADAETIFTFRNFIAFLGFLNLFTFDFIGFICNPRKYFRDAEARQSINSDTNVAETDEHDPENDSKNTIIEFEMLAEDKKNL